MTVADGAERLTAKTLSGMRWTYLAMAVGAVLQLVFAGVMGRLLDPTAFGLMAMAGVVLRFGTYFARMGVGAALVQKVTLDDDDVRAGFGSNVGLGLVFTALLWAAAPLAVFVFDEPGVVPVLRWMSLSLLVAGLYGTSQALLRRELRFRVLAYWEILSYVVGYLLIGIGLAVLGAGVYSLVAATLSQALIVAVLNYASARHPIRPVLRWEPYKRLYGFGARVSIISFMEFLASNLDTFAVGRFAGTAPLGQYNRAYLLVNLPLQHMTTSFTKVLFPSFSRAQTQIARLRGAYLSIVGIMATVLIPTCAGIAVAAPEVVTVVLGPQWGDAQRILPILAFAASINLLSHIAGVLCEAAALLNEKIRLQGLYLVALVGFFALAVGRDLEAYAFAVLAGEALRQIGYLRLMRRAFSVHLPDMLHRYGSAVLAGVLVALAVSAVRAALHVVGAPLPVILAATVAAGALALLTAVRTPPFRVMREDVYARLGAAGAFDSNPAMRRIAQLVIGREVRRAPSAARVAGDR